VSRVQSENLETFFPLSVHSVLLNFAGLLTATHALISADIRSELVNGRGKYRVQ